MIDREMNTALYVLRCIQCGISVGDMERLSMGLIFDMFTEAKNDEYDYPYCATQADMDEL